MMPAENPSDKELLEVQMNLSRAPKVARWIRQQIRFCSEASLLALLEWVAFLKQDITGPSHSASQKGGTEKPRIV